jgi:hypothetical protein
MTSDYGALGRAGIEPGDEIYWYLRSFIIHARRRRMRGLKHLRGKIPTDVGMQNYNVVAS